MICLLLSLLPRALGSEEAGTDGLKTREKEFRAFDCSKPANLTTLTQARHKGCHLQEPQVSQAEKTYRVVQEVQRIRFNVYLCKARRSRVAFHCYYDAVISYHAFPMVREWFMNRLYPIPVKDCGAMWRDEEFIGPYRPEKDHRYKLNTPGRTYVTNVAWGDMYYHKNKPKCEGWDHWKLETPSVWGGWMPGNPDWNTEYDKMTVTDYYEFDMLELTAEKAPDGSISIPGHPDNPLTLPSECTVDGEGCVAGDAGTFIWEKPDDLESCRIFSALPDPITGQEFVDAQGRTVFYQDDHMIRLEKRTVISKCGTLLYQTDFSNLYLTEDLENEVAKRPVPANEMSIITYANQQDSFVYEEIVSLIASELKELRQQQCQREMDMRAGEYARRAAEQQASLDGETAMIAENYFATAAGEVWYTYRCKPIIVLAIPSDDCYSALPVRLAASDEEDYVQNRNINPQDATNISFFLEPKTHRLTTIAAPIHCASPIVPLYRNRFGHWIAWDGASLYRAVAPATIESQSFPFEDEEEEDDVKYRDLNFETGIYTKDQVDNMELFSTAPRRIQDFTTTATRHVPTRRRPGQDYRGREIFPDIPSPDLSSRFLQLDTLWNFLAKYGEAMAVIVGTTFLIKFFTWLVGVVFRLCATPITGSILLHVGGALFPSVSDYIRNARIKKITDSTSTHRTAFSPPHYRVDDQEVKKKEDDEFDSFPDAPPPLPPPRHLDEDGGVVQPLRLDTDCQQPGEAGPR